MSALLTHAAFGLLLGIAIRLPARQLPLAALLAIVPDIDHVEFWAGSTILQARGTLHNAFVVAIIPTLIFVVMAVRGLGPKWQRLAAGAPLFLTSHALLDMLPLETYGGGGRVKLLYPFDTTAYGFNMVFANRLDPTAYSTFTFLTLAFVTLIGLVLLGARAPSAPWKGRGLAAYTIIWILLIPASVGTGLAVPKVGHPNASITIEWSRLDLPEGRVSASILHAGGEYAPAGALTAQVMVNGTVTGSVKNPFPLYVGQRWVAVANVSEPRLRAAYFFTVNNVSDGVEYAKQVTATRRGHADANITLVTLRESDDEIEATLRLEGNWTLPPGALRASFTVGESQQNSTSPRLTAPGTWVVRAARSLETDQAVTLRVTAVDDGFRYLSVKQVPLASDV